VTTNSGLTGLATLQREGRHPSRKLGIRSPDFVLAGASAGARMSAMTRVHDCYGAW